MNLDIAHVDNQNVDAQAEDSMQFLSFIMESEEYAIDILRVMEIRGWEKPTPLPNVPDFVRGVINLRGAVVPIIDLRMRFKLAEIEYTPKTVVIVLQVQHGDKSRTLGVVVDAVSEVYSIDHSMIKRTPEVVNNDSVDFIMGLATLDEKMVILLDVEQLFLKDGDITIPDNVKDMLSTG